MVRWRNEHYFTFKNAKTIMNKFVFTLMLMVCANHCLAQTYLHSSANVGAGNLTFEEWMKQNKWDRLEEAIPSLLFQKEKKEKENPFKEDDYYNT